VNEQLIERKLFGWISLFNLFSMIYRNNLILLFTFKTYWFKVFTSYFIKADYWHFIRN